MIEGLDFEFGLAVIDKSRKFPPIQTGTVLVSPVGKMVEVLSVEQDLNEIYITRQEETRVRPKLIVAFQLTYTDNDGKRTSSGEPIIMDIHMFYLMLLMHEYREFKNDK